MAGGDLRHPRLLVNATLSPRLPAEVFHGVRDVNLRAVDARTFERPVQHAAGGTDEQLADAVLFVAGLLADEHDRRVRRAGTEDRLRGATPEITASAIGSRGLCRRKRRTNWHEWPG